MGIVWTSFISDAGIVRLASLLFIAYLAGALYLRFKSGHGSVAIAPDNVDAMLCARRLITAALWCVAVIVISTLASVFVLLTTEQLDPTSTSRPAYTEVVWKSTTVLESFVILVAIALGTRAISAVVPVFRLGDAIDARDSDESGGASAGR